MSQLGFGDVRQMGMEKATPGEVEDWMERLLPLRDPREARGSRGIVESRRGGDLLSASLGSRSGVEVAEGQHGTGRRGWGEGERGGAAGKGSDLGGAPGEGGVATSGREIAARGGATVRAGAAG